MCVCLVNSLAGTPVSDPEGTFPDLTFPDRRKQRTSNGANSEDEVSLMGSPYMTRRRIGSFNGQNGDPNSQSMERSPDITPNGSLRRRRSSRVLSEEDEGNLMEFLRASGHDNATRERGKGGGWGSLDRSWARRARGSGPRKRPALLGAELLYSAENRERPSSPSPLASTEEKVQQTPEVEPEEKSAKPREWRQKIESWLRDSESDQVSTRRSGNRRSLEMDSGNVSKINLYFRNL